MAFNNTVSQKALDSLSSTNQGSRVMPSVLAVSLISRREGRKIAVFEVNLNYTQLKVLSQPGLHIKTLPQKYKTKQKELSLNEPSFPAPVPTMKTCPPILRWTQLTQRSFLTSRVTLPSIRHTVSRRGRSPHLPTARQVVMLQNWASCLVTECTWMPSSLVGTSTSTRVTAA